MAKKIKTGKGVYEQDRISYDLTDESDVAAMREHLKSWVNPDRNKNPFERALPRLDEWIAAMEALPDTDTGTPPEKAEARKIGHELKQARKYITNEASARAAYHGYLLGRLLERMAIDAKHGKTLETGQKSVKNLDDGRKVAAEAKQAQAETKHEAMKRMNADLVSKRPDMGASARADHILERVRKENGQKYSRRRVLEILAAKPAE